MVKYLIKPILFLLSLLCLCTCSKPVITSVQITSVDEQVVVHCKLIEQALFYELAFKGQRVLEPSRLGFELQDQAPLANNLVITKVEETKVDDTWTQVWGEQKQIRNHYKEAIIHLEESDSLQRKLLLHFRVFNDGIGFAYEIPEQENIDSVKIINELTEFNLAKDLSAWFTPANFDSYEALYQNKAASAVSSANTPVTFEAEDQSLFLSIHEAQLTNYAGMTLKKQGGSPLSFQANLVPWPDGIKVKGKAPLRTPWRTLQLGGTAADLIASNLILNLNEPNQLADVSWIKPTKYIGIWWGMHLGTQTWTRGERHGATTENVKRYINFAAENKIESVLAEGWNTGWEYWGQAKAFDFVTPYEDFDLSAVVAYAKEKGVSLIGHHETGGDAAYYEKQMHQAFALYQALGIHQVKTGYAGPIVPRGQFHHGQYMVEHYRKVVETAAQYQLMLNAHEPIKPTGIRRTFPNMMTREGARGMEWNAWSEGNPPEHHLILPFTRILGGPMDYTPGIFDILYKNAGKRVKWNGQDKGTSRVNTTLAKQLALYLILYSPQQMAADLIENYEGQAAFQFFRSVPVDWEETKVLEAKIGDYLAIARKDQNSEDWYLGAATDENQRRLSIALDFLAPKAKYLATRYADAADADWKNNPYAHQILQQEVLSTDSLVLQLAPGGGQAIRFQRLK